MGVRRWACAATAVRCTHDVLDNRRNLRPLALLELFELVAEELKQRVDEGAVCLLLGDLYIALGLHRFIELVGVYLQRGRGRGRCDRGEVRAVNADVKCVTI